MKEIQLLAQKILGLSFSLSNTEREKSLRELRQLKINVGELYEKIVLLQEKLKNEDAGKKIETQNTTSIQRAETLENKAKTTEAQTPSVEKKQEKQTPQYNCEKKETNTSVLQNTHTNKTINDIKNKELNFGLNDRLAFEKHLFQGNTDVFNQVILYLNATKDQRQAIGFIQTSIKPKFGGWEGKEEYEKRFIDMVKKKFE